MKIEKEVSKETYELVQGISGFLQTIVDEYKDGGLDITDIPEILHSGLVDLVPAFDGFSEVDDEMINNPKEFAAAASELVGNIMAMILELRVGRNTSK